MIYSLEIILSGYWQEIRSGKKSINSEVIAPLAKEKPAPVNAPDVEVVKSKPINEPVVFEAPVVDPLQEDKIEKSGLTVKGKIELPSAGGRKRKENKR